MAESLAKSVKRFGAKMQIKPIVRTGSGCRRRSRRPYGDVSWSASGGTSMKLRYSPVTGCSLRLRRRRKGRNHDAGKGFDRFACMSRNLKGEPGLCLHRRRFRRHQRRTRSSGSQKPEGRPITRAIEPEDILLIPGSRPGCAKTECSAKASRD